MIVGLAQSDAGKKYLKEVQGLRYAGDVAGVSTFIDAAGRYFVGGQKGIYSVIVGETEQVLRKLEKWRQGKEVYYNFSMDRDPFGSKRIDSVVDLQGIVAQDREQLYEKDVRRCVRQVAESALTYQTGSAPRDWYELYCAFIRSLGSKPRSPQWFVDMERCFGTQVVCFTARDGSALAGVFYCLTSPEYLELLFIATDKQYRKMHVDHSLYDQIILYAIERNIRFVDFGPTMRTDERHWRMKENFGAETFYFADRSFVSSIRRIREAWQRFAWRMRRRMHLK